MLRSIEVDQCRTSASARILARGSFPHRAQGFFSMGACKSRSRVKARPLIETEGNVRLSKSRVVVAVQK